jgi:hypothetical protein
MTDELERIWKEAVVVSSRNYPGICLEGLKKTMKNLRHLITVRLQLGERNTVIYNVDF